MSSATNAEPAVPGSAGTRQDTEVEALISAACEAEELFDLDDLERHAAELRRRAAVAREVREGRRLA